MEIWASTFDLGDNFPWAKLVFSFDKFPILNKMTKQVNNRVSSHLQGYIMPRHSDLKRLVQI
jgi:hypothetical protein